MSHNRTPQYLIDEARTLVMGGMSRVDVAKRLGMGVATVTNHTKDLSPRSGKYLEPWEITNLFMRWQRG